MFGMRTGEPPLYGRPTIALCLAMAYGWRVKNPCGFLIRNPAFQPGVCSSIRKPVERIEPVEWTISEGGLNASLPSHLHPLSIKPVLYGSPKMPRLRAGFELRCFQLLSLTAWLPSGALSDNW